MSSNVAPTSPTSTLPNNTPSQPQSNVESLGDVNLFDAAPAGTTSDDTGAANGITTEAVTGKKSKDSILALYGGAGSATGMQPQQQMFAGANTMQGINMALTMQKSHYSPGNHHASHF